MKRIHIIGHKNSGKTSLIVDLVAEFTRRGFQVGTIKHTHHDHELDTPGKDSHRHREAGSAAVGILTRRMNAIFWPQENQPTGDDKYNQFDTMMEACDIVLVEGDSQNAAPKIEVYRSNNELGNGKQPISATDSSVIAVVTDDSPVVHQPLWRRSDLNLIATNLEKEFNLTAK